MVFCQLSREGADSFLRHIFGSFPVRSFQTRSRRSLGQSPTSTLPKRGLDEIPRRACAHQRPRQAGQSRNPAKSRGPGGANLPGGCQPWTRSRPEGERGPKAQVRAGTIKLAPFRRPASISGTDVSFWVMIVSRSGESLLIFSAPCPRRFEQRSNWIGARSPKGDSGRLPPQRVFPPDLLQHDPQETPAGGERIPGATELADWG